MRIAILVPLVAASALAQSPARGSLPSLPACAAIPICAAILRPFEEKEVAALSDSARLLAAVMQSGAAMAALRSDYTRQIAGAGYCFKPRAPVDSALVGAASAPMQARLPRLRECRSDEALPNPPRPWRVLPEPGTQIVGLRLVSLAVSGDRATTRFGIGSAVYECVVMSQSGIWRPDSCTLIGAG